MKLYIGKDVLEPVYYERKGFWCISRNGRETIYNKDREWVTFETEREAEEYLIDKISNQCEGSWLVG